MYSSCFSAGFVLASCTTPGVHQNFRDKINALFVSYNSTEQCLTVVVSEMACVCNGICETCVG